MTPYEILQYYYGGDINLVMNAPVGGNVASYSGRPLRRGDAGNDVQTLKRQLNRIGKNYPAIPALDDSFVFDGDMEEAVRIFQQIFNLAQDGIVGKATWYKIKQDVYKRQSMPRLVRYFFTISATLKVMASSNSRRSRPVSFLIFSSRYTSVFRWTNSFRAVSETFRLFSKNL